MALVLKDRVRETSVTTGTGTLDLLGAVTGYQTFVSAVGSTNTCYYSIYNQGTTEWEVGLGTVTSGSPNTLSRDTVLESSNSGSLVTFTAGTKDVFLTYPAEKSVYLDASGNASALGTVSSGTWNATAISNVYGGTGQNSSSWTGLAKITSGTWAQASAGTDYAAATTGTNAQLLANNGSGGFNNVTVGSGLTYSGGTLSSTGSMVYPGAGIPNSTGSAWGTSYSTTGSGTVVALATSPTLVTPLLGTPTSGTLTNCTGLPLSTGVTGTLATTNGGTGLTSFTSGGAVYATSTSALTTATLPLTAGGTGQTTAPAANAALTGFTSTPTAAGTTTLTNTSSYYQLFTGTTTQTVRLPQTSTLATGWSFHIVNNSTGLLTLQTFGGAATLGTIPAGVTVMATALTITGDTAADWEFGYTDFSTITGTGNNVLDTNPTITNPTVTNYVETANPLTTSGGTATIDLANGTVVTATLTSATPLTVTMPTAASGKSFIAYIKQPASGTATTIAFTSVVWAGGSTPAATLTLGRMDIFSFFSDGSKWFGVTVAQNYTY